MPLDAKAMVGSPGRIADWLASFAELGVGHLQLVLDPITASSMERMGEVLALIDR